MVLIVEGTISDRHPRGENGDGGDREKLRPTFQIMPLYNATSLFLLYTLFTVYTVPTNLMWPDDTTP